MRESNLLYEIREKFNVNGLGNKNSDYEIIVSIFLLKLIELNKNAKTMDDLRAIFALQTGIKNGELTREIIDNSLTAAEHMFDLEPHYLSGSRDLYDIFLSGNRYSGAIVKTLNELSLPQTDEEFSDLISELLEDSAFNWGKRSDSYGTPSSIAKLSLGLLDVQKDEAFINAFAGISSVVSYLNEANSYVGFEINSDMAFMSKLSLLMASKLKSEIIPNDFFTESFKHTADKVFCDGPLNIRLTQEQKDAIYQHTNEEVNESESAKLLCCDHLLREGGRAILVEPGRLMFGSNGSIEKIRKKYSDSGLKALVYLPSGCLVNSTIPVTLVVIEKDYEGDVTLIDASKMGTRLAYGVVTSLSDAEIKNIISAFRGTLNNSDIVKTVSRKEMYDENGDTNWIQARFFFKKEEKVFRDVADIDTDINEVMSELQAIVK